MALQITGNIDRTTVESGLVNSITNLTPRIAPQMVAGDLLSIDVFLTSTGGTAVDIQAFTFQRLGIGTLNARPNGGSFTLTFAETTPVSLSFDMAASDLQTAISNAGEANTTQEIAPFTFITDFTSAGSKTIPTIDSTGLTPSSTATIQKLIVGSGTTVYERWITRLFQNPVALIDSSWTNITDAAGNKGIQGSLNLGTQGVFDLIDNATSATATLELELTDSTGNVQTIFQTPIRLFSQVIGSGATVPAGSTGIPASATAFLNSFPNPNIEGNFSLDGEANLDNDVSINGDIVIAGTTEFQNDLDVTNGGISLLDGGLELAGGGDLEISAGGKLKVGTFVVDSTDGTVTGTQSFTGIVRMPTVRTQLLESSNATAQSIKVRAKEFRFMDIDGNPDDLLVIKKIDPKPGGRVGINTDDGDPKCALHVIHNSSDGYPSNEAIRCTGGLRISNWLRLGPYTDSERDAIGLDPPPGLMIYNEERYEVQVFIANPSGSGRGSWKAFTLQDVAT